MNVAAETSAAVPTSESAGPLLSIVMPTLNAEKTISMALGSIASQSCPQTMVEVIVADGGSNDRTVEIARKFGATVIANPRVLIEDGKIMGLSVARGSYAMLMDSDEVLVDPDALLKKIALLQAHPEVRNVVTAGLLNPPGFPGINDYTNRFGEPFSFFLYRLDGGDYVSSLRENYTIDYEDESSLIVRFREGETLPICDAGGHCFDLRYLRELTGRDYVPSLFNRMARETNRLAVVKGDFMLHYSTVSVRQLVKKLNWRIITNMHREIGNEGYVNREEYFTPAFRRKKFLFPLYGLTLIGPAYDAVALTLRYRDVTYLMHFPLSVYAAAAIGWQFLRKLAGMPPRVPSYATADALPDDPTRSSG